MRWRCERSWLESKPVSVFLCRSFLSIHPCLISQINSLLSTYLSALATAEANFAKKTKEHMVEMNSTKESHRELKTQLQASQDTLAAVVLEKQRLVSENVEMKAVCEELMSMVEGGKENTL